MRTSYNSANSGFHHRFTSLLHAATTPVTPAVTQGIISMRRSPWTGQKKNSKISPSICVYQPPSSAERDDVPKRNLCP